MGAGNKLVNGRTVGCTRCVLLRSYSKPRFPMFVRARHADRLFVRHCSTVWYPPPPTPAAPLLQSRIASDRLRSPPPLHVVAEKHAHRAPKSRPASSWVMHESKKHTTITPTLPSTAVDSLSCIYTHVPLPNPRHHARKSPRTPGFEDRSHAFALSVRFFFSNKTLMMMMPSHGPRQEPLTSPSRLSSPTGETHKNNRRTTVGD